MLFLSTQDHDNSEKQYHKYTPNVEHYSGTFVVKKEAMVTD